MALKSKKARRGKQVAKRKEKDKSKKGGRPKRRKVW